MTDMTFKGWPIEAVEFYEGLEADNSKVYWLANKEVYENCVRAPMEALLADLESSDVRVRDQAVQILGGMGFMRGTRVERIYREVKVMMIGGGAEEIMKELAAKQLGI